MFAMYLFKNSYTLPKATEIGPRLLAAGALDGSFRPKAMASSRPWWSCLWDFVLKQLDTTPTPKLIINQESQYEAYQYVLSRVAQEVGSHEVFMATVQENCRS